MKNNAQRRKPRLNSLNGSYLLVPQLREDLNLCSNMLTGPARNWSSVDNLIDDYFSSSNLPTFSDTDAYDLAIKNLSKICNMNEKTKLHRLLKNYAVEISAYLKNAAVKDSFLFYYKQRLAQFRAVKEGEKTGCILSQRGARMLGEEFAPEGSGTKRGIEQVEEDHENEFTKKNRTMNTPSEENRDDDDDDDEEEEEEISFHSIDYHPLRKQKYQLMDVCRNYAGGDESLDWFVNDINICQELRAFGLKSLELNDKLDGISDMRLLQVYISLDHVYALSPRIEVSSTKYLGQELHHQTMNLVSSEDVFPFVSTTISDACMKLSLINNNIPWDTFMKLCGSIINSSITGDKEDLLYSSIIYKIATILYGVTNGSNIEDTFVHNHVHNLLASMFSCDKIFSQEWANCSLEASNFYKPDWIGSVKPWKTKYNVVVGEVKPPSKTNRGVISDFAKLGRQMKLALEEIIDSGVDNPQSFGILFQGGDVTLYTMDLKYPGVYRLIELDNVIIPMRFEDCLQLTRTLPIMYRFKERVLNFVRTLENHELRKSKGLPSKPSIPSSWRRTSANAAIKIIKRSTQ